MSPHPDLILHLLREVPISPEQCFEGWTVPERLMPWFCPRPWQVVACTIEPRPGGASRQAAMLMRRWALSRAVRSR
jgi:uncharacterized protein YndB with AHSA1/START domain